MIYLISQTSSIGGFDNVTSLGAAGLMGAMWLWERRTSRQREQQLDESHARILGDRIALDEVIAVVRQNAEAMTRLSTLHEQLLSRLRFGTNPTERKTP